MHIYILNYIHNWNDKKKLMTINDKYSRIDLLKFYSFAIYTNRHPLAMIDLLVLIYSLNYIYTFAYGKCVTKLVNNIFFFIKIKVWNGLQNLNQNSAHISGELQLQYCWRKKSQSKHNKLCIALNLLLLQLRAQIKIFFLSFYIA